jgi:uncharacterized phage protein gp47/JayE
VPFARPPLTALRNQAIQDITTSGVPGLDGLLRNAVLRVLAWVMSGLAYSVYGYLDWIMKEAVPFTATDEYLEAWAALIGIYRKDATAATGQAQFVGSPGLALPTGAGLTRQDGTPYTVTASGVVDANGFVTVPIVAAAPGAVTNADSPVPISIDMPVGGINSGGMTVGPLVGGSDQESTEAFRSRMLFKYRNPPQGGCAADYVEWALEVPGCTRAWVQGSGYGPGSLIVYVMFDDAEAVNGGFPVGADGCATKETRGPTATGDQLIVADHIYPLQPVTALVWVSSPAPLKIDVLLHSLDPNTPEMHAEIVATLTDMFLGVSEVGGTIYPSDLYNAILATPGINHFAMASPAAPIVAATGALPVMGTLTVT